MLLSSSSRDSDPHADDIAGDVVVDGAVLEDWGFHLIDMNVAMGNLLSLASTQGAAWLAAQSNENAEGGSE